MVFPAPFEGTILTATPGQTNEFLSWDAPSPGEGFPSLNLVYKYNAFFYWAETLRRSWAARLGCAPDSTWRTLYRAIDAKDIEHHILEYEFIRSFRQIVGGKPLSWERLGTLLHAAGLPPGAEGQKRDYPFQGGVNGGFLDADYSMLLSGKRMRAIWSQRCDKARHRFARECHLPENSRWPTIAQWLERRGADSQKARLLVTLRFLTGGRTALRWKPLISALKRLEQPATATTSLIITNPLASDARKVPPFSSTAWSRLLAASRKKSVEAQARLLYLYELRERSVCVCPGGV